MASGDVVLDVASDAVSPAAGAKSKSRKGKVSKEKKPRAPPSHPPYAESGLMDNGTKVSLLGVWMALFVVFAARKFQQPIKDDIGDKSVFMFNALPEKVKKLVKEALLEKLDRKLE